MNWASITLAQFFYMKVWPVWCRGVLGCAPRVNRALWIDVWLAGMFVRVCNGAYYDVCGEMVACFVIFLIIWKNNWRNIWLFKNFAVLLQRNSGTKATLGRLAQLV